MDLERLTDMSNQDKILQVLKLQVKWFVMTALVTLLR